MEENKSLIVFQDKIRRIWYNNEWYFSVVDVVYALTDSADPKDYWYKMKIREKESSEIELSTICRPLKLVAEDGKMRETDCANVKNLFRIIQSIPSPKAEPFKLWLAQVGYERIKEIENPELAQIRMKELYRQKGYSEEWIEKRVRGIVIRQELTDEWKKREISEKSDYAILTDEISKATFGKSVEEYKQFKGLEKENLCEHMNDLELIFNMLGEKITTEITKSRDSMGLRECKEDAKQGGEVAGNARIDAENKIGKPISSNENFLDAPEKEKRKRLK